ncbi:MAG: DNA-3-methyladenine glycosylase I [Alcanivorax sp.]|nr:DNA-3-methyladenine glycosylase I [Alcanivorax sp.]
MADKNPQRCPWCGNDPLYQHYHDHEWGVPVHDDDTLFEFLVLEGAQAGLSWITVLRKRDRYREVFDQFQPHKVARYTDHKVQRLLADPGIVRNRLKVASAIRNARAFLAVQDEFDGFHRYLWDFVDGEPVINRFRSMKQVPAVTPLAEQISKDLKRRGFNFVGPTIIYAYMQAVGLVNDHLVSCPRHAELGG